MQLESSTNNHYSLKSVHEVLCTFFFSLVQGLINDHQKVLEFFLLLYYDYKELVGRRGELWGRPVLFNG